MKKSNLLTTAAAVMLLTAAPAAAQTCIKTPSCADLGYTKTAADCAGKTILKCPLDNTQVYCPGYEETLRTYKVGDTYIGKDGVGVGIVVQVDASGKHGVVAISAGAGDANTATTTCSSKTAGGLNWGVATGENSCKADKGSSCCGCTLRSSSGNGYCSGFIWNIYNISDCQSADKALGFYCEAPF